MISTLNTQFESQQNPRNAHNDNEARNRKGMLQTVAVRFEKFLQNQNQMEIHSYQQNTVNVLVIGDVQGRFEEIFAVLPIINRNHGPFHFALFVGTFFGTQNELLDPYIKGERKIEIPCYFITSNENEEGISFLNTIADRQLSQSQKSFFENGGQITENLHYLGKMGIITIHNLNIAYLSGIYDKQEFPKTRENPSKYDPFCKLLFCFCFFCCEIAYFMHAILRNQIPFFFIVLVLCTNRHYKSKQ